MPDKEAQLFMFTTMAEWMMLTSEGHVEVDPRVQLIARHDAGSEQKDFRGSDPRVDEFLTTLRITARSAAGLCFARYRPWGHRNCLQFQNSCRRFGSPTNDSA
jgi:hypothetical protein